MDKRCTTLFEIPRVSVIIPTYNRSFVLSRALKSVFQQSFRNFEVIVVDDGSTDALDYMLKLHSDQRMRVIKHFENKGAAAARNTAIKEARGDIIAFLDSDDEWHPAKLEEQIAHFDILREKNKNIMGSFTWFFLYRQNGERELRQFKKVKDWKHYFLEGCFISPGSTLIVDKKVYEYIGLYDESFKRFEDWEWLLRFSKKFDLIGYETPLSYIYQGEKPSYQNICFPMKKLIQIHKRNFSTHQKIKFLSACYLELFYSCIGRNIFRASYFFILAIATNPTVLRKVFTFFIKNKNNPTC